MSNDYRMRTMRGYDFFDFVEYLNKNFKTKMHWDKLAVAYKPQKV